MTGIMAKPNELTDEDYRKAISEVLKSPMILGFVANPARLGVLCEPVKEAALERQLTIVIDPNMPEDQIGVLASNDQGLSPQSVTLQ